MGIVWFLIWLLFLMPAAYSAFGGWGFLGSLVILVFALIPMDVYADVFTKSKERK